MGESIKNIDKSNMRNVILNFPEQFSVGLKVAQNIKVEGKFNGILVCGMGGSAFAPDILKIWLKNHKIDLPLHIHRNYGIPFQTDRNDLVVCSSYSGNTEETISAFKEALKYKLEIAVITSGGKLAELSKKNNIPLILIPPGLQPRMAVGFQLAALVKLLANCGILKDCKDISSLSKTLNPKNLEIKGKDLAKKIKGKIPVVYSSLELKAIARIWKIKFNENSKIPAFFNSFPELNHNELVGFTNPANFHVIILEDFNDNPRNKKRMALTAKLLKQKGFPVDILEIKGKDILYKVFENLLLADWASYYLALELGFDPTPVKIIEEFKKQIK